MSIIQVIFGIILLTALPYVSSVDRKECAWFMMSENGMMKSVYEMFVRMGITCIHAPYKGPVGDVILTYTPRPLAKATTDHSKALIDNMARISGNIPVVGSFFSSALSLYSGNFGSSIEGTINKIVEDIEEEIKNLKKYVDARIEEHEVTRLSQELKGFLNGAKFCSSYKDNNPDYFSSCLVSLNVKLVTEYKNYAPDEQNIASYEQTLPLFRQFGDLHLTVLQDLMKMDKKSGNTKTYNNHLRKLKETAQNMYDHSKRAIQRIIKSHTDNFSSRTCSTYLEWEDKNNPFSLMSGQCGTCSQTFDGKTCSSSYCVKPNVRGGKWKALAINKACMDMYRNEFTSKLKKDIETYWNIELIKVTENWKKLADKADDQMKKMEIPPESSSTSEDDIEEDEDFGSYEE